MPVRSRRELPDVFDLPDGRRLGYRVFGVADGMPLVALHGTPASSLLFRLADEAARDRNVRLIAPDRPGYGRSTPCPGYALARWAGDIPPLLEHLGIGRFRVLGVSGGGPFAVALAALIPERVEGLGLVSPIGLLDPEARCSLSPVQALLFRHLPCHARSRRLALALSAPLMRKAPNLVIGLTAAWLGAADRRMLSDPAGRAAIADAMREAVAQGAAGIDDDLRLFGNDWGLPLADIRAPALVWQGLSDRLVPPGSAFALHQRIGSSRVIELPAAGHFWVLAHVGEVLDALLALGPRDA
jgi:pimeloyl-ACP methyl ester carboxylesterase